MNPIEIKALRSSLGLTQESFAVLVGVAQLTISRWETAAAKPTRLAVQKLKQLKQQMELDVYEN